MSMLRLSGADRFGIGVDIYFYIIRVPEFVSVNHSVGCFLFELFVHSFQFLLIDFRNEKRKEVAINFGYWGNK